MCEPFLRRECIQSQDARAYWKACCGRVGIWHCAAYYPRMHEMPCHLQTGHARCRCCCRRRRHSCMPRPCGRASLSPNETNAPFQQTLFLNKNSLSHSCKWYAQPLPSSPFFTFQNRVCIPLWKLESIHSNPEIIHRVSNKQSWIFGRNFFFFSIDRLHFFSK